jgi:transposase-like protein
MARKYSTFSADFKLDTVMEGFRGEKRIAQICRERDIMDMLYYNWRDTFLENAANAFGDQGNNRTTNYFTSTTNPYEFDEREGPPLSDIFT